MALNLLLIGFGVGFLALLVVLALIQPRWLKDFVRRVNDFERWTYGDAAPLMPMDPYKPLSEAFDEHQFPPFKERMKNASKLLAIEWAIAITIAVLFWWIISILTRG